jgi:hypothetical protein
MSNHSEFIAIDDKNTKISLTLEGIGIPVDLVKPVLSKPTCSLECKPVILFNTRIRTNLTVKTLKLTSSQVTSDETPIIDIDITDNSSMTVVECDFLMDSSSLQSFIKSIGLGEIIIDEC